MSFEYSLLKFLNTSNPDEVCNIILQKKLPMSKRNTTAEFSDFFAQRDVIAAFVGVS